MCEPVRMFVRSIGLPLALAALGGRLRSSPPPRLAVPECDGKEEWRFIEGSVFWCIGIFYAHTSDGGPRAYKLYDRPHHRWTRIAVRDEGNLRQSPLHYEDPSHIFLGRHVKKQALGASILPTGVGGACSAPAQTINSEVGTIAHSQNAHTPTSERGRSTC